MTLVEFYSSLDKIERTSSMGERFLKAYAEKLHDEVCKQCWLEQTTAEDNDIDDDDDEQP